MIIQRVSAIICQENKFLLVKIASLKHYFDPGGKVEAGEDTLVALKRELLEELSATIKSATQMSTREYPAQYFADQTFAETVFHVTLASQPKASAEIEEIRFVTYAESKTIPVMDSTQELIEIAKEQNLI